MPALQRLRPAARPRADVHAELLISRRRAVTLRRHRSIATSSAASTRRKNVILLCSSLALSTLAAEWIVRVVAPQKVYRFPPGLMVDDPQLQYRLAANFRGAASTGEYRVALRISSQGLREDREFGSKPANVQRILAIGDSFTMGVGVESSEAFPAVLGDMLRQDEPEAAIEVINAGVPGYNTSQELTHLEREGARLEPDLVLLNLFIGNDIRDNFVHQPVKVVDGYLESAADDPGGLLPHGLRGALNRSHFYLLLWPVQRRLRDPLFEEAERRRQEAVNIIYSPEPGPEGQPMWSATWTQLDRAKDLARTHGCGLVIVLIPELRQLDAVLWRKTTGSAGSRYVRNEPNRRITAYGAGAGIPVLDLLPTFAAVENPRESYFLVDGHWTVKGNRLAASDIHEFLIEQRLLAGDRDPRPRRARPGLTP